MLLGFDVADEAIVEHDDWHTHEHLPERLGIPGFLRGTRWVAHRGGPRYLVLYEVEALATLTSDAYLARLNQPSPWTARMMPHYRGMIRGLCSVTGSFGYGIGGMAALVRFKARAEMESSLRAWLVDECLPSLPVLRGIGSAHLLEGTVTPSMTNEQRIRGADAAVDWAVLVTGYRQDALQGVLDESLSRAAFEAHGASDATEALYGLDYLLGNRELVP